MKILTTDKSVLVTDDKGQNYKGPANCFTADYNDKKDGVLIKRWGQVISFSPLDNLTINGTQANAGNIDSLLEKLFFLNKSDDDDDDPVPADWTPPVDWYDIKQIIENDTPPEGLEARLIILMSDSEKDFQANRYISTWANSATVKLSDGTILTSNTEVHVWDTSYDKPCSDGYSTRWMIFYNSPTDRVINVNNNTYHYLWIYVYNGDASMIRTQGSCQALEISDNVISTRTSGSDILGWECVSPNGTLQKLDLFKNQTRLSGGPTVFTAVRGLNFPDTLRSVDANAFSNAYQLNFSKLNLNKVEVINGSAFTLCEGVGKLMLPSTLTTVNGAAFRYCYNMTDIVFPSPNNISAIGDYAFADCGRVKSVIIEEGVPCTFGNYVFSMGVSIEEVDLPKSITVMGTYTFANCHNLKKAKIRSAMGNYMFQNCHTLKEIEFYPDVTTVIPYECNAYNRSLEKVTIAEGFTELARGVFYGCQSLKHITLPSTITALGYDCLGNCQNLKEIILPEGLTTLSGNLCNMCSGLERFYIPSTLTTITNALDLPTASGDLKWIDCAEGWVFPSNITTYNFNGSGSMSQEGLVTFANHLGATETAITLRFHAQVLNGMSDVVKAIFTSKGYTLTT